MNNISFIIIYIGYFTKIYFILNKRVKPSSVGSENLKKEHVKPWPQRASASASASVSILMLPSMLENGYDTDAWCGLYRYKLMWAHTDARCGQGLKETIRIKVSAGDT